MMDEQTVSITNRLMTDIYRLDKRIENWYCQLMKLTVIVEEIQREVDRLKVDINEVNQLMGKIGER